ncbi:MAG: hypothetical protein ACRDL0_04445 [Thermoleophilaceae bacterium]
MTASLAVGCGGDDEPAADPSPALPELTVPETDPEAGPEPEPEPEPEATAPAPAPEPEPEPTPTPAPAPEPPPDSPESDTPPPPDSPAERFEEFCEENPGACG